MATTVKQALREMAERLSENASWEEVEDLVRLRRKLEEGLDDAEAGRLYSSDEVRQHLRLSKQ